MNNAGGTPAGSTAIVRWLGWLFIAGFAVGGAFVGDIYASSAGKLQVFGLSIHRISAWQLLYALGFVGYVLLLWTFRRKPVSTWAILLVAVLLRTCLLFAPPNSDCNRYIWEGRIQGEGFNPYVHAPQSEALRHLRGDIYEGINKKHYSTIYPPLSELEFRFLSNIRYSIKTPQIFHTILDIAVVFALAGLLKFMGQPAWYLAIYALCPLVLASFAHAGHNDTLMILGVLGFLAAGRQERWGWAGLALGLAILAKTTPAILLALLVRRSWKAIGVAMVTICLGYLFYIDAGTDLFKVLGQFPSQDGPFNNLFDELRVWIRKQGGPVLFLRGRNLIAIGILIGLTAYRIWRPRALLQDARTLLAAVVLMLPIIHFWYLSWPLALIALRPKGYWSWVILTGTMALYWYADWAVQVGQRWRLPLWAVAAIWGPFFLAWVAEAIWQHRKPETRQVETGSV